MRISDLLKEETITIMLSHKDKQGILEALLDLAMKTGNINDRAVALKAVMDRETLMSTGLEKGIAVPHAKTKAADGLAMSLGISKEGIDFDSADGEPSHLFFFLIAPETAARQNIQVLAQIARLTNDATLCEQIKSASSSNEVFDLIKRAES